MKSKNYQNNSYLHYVKRQEKASSNKWYIAGLIVSAVVTVSGFYLINKPLFGLVGLAAFLLIVHVFRLYRNVEVLDGNKPLMVDKKQTRYILSQVHKFIYNANRSENEISVLSSSSFSVIRCFKAIPVGNGISRRGEVLSVVFNDLLNDDKTKISFDMLRFEKQKGELDDK